MVDSHFPPLSFMIEIKRGKCNITHMFFILLGEHVTAMIISGFIEQSETGWVRYFRSFLISLSFLNNKSAI